MRACRIFTAVLVLLFVQVCHADGHRKGDAAVPKATSFPGDVTGLWLAAGESGWGVNIVHQGSTLFATVMVYRPDGSPAWYVASEVSSYLTPGIAGAHFKGPLYESSGPWYGAAFFNEAAVTLRVVGEINFVFNLIPEGTVTFTIDGVTVSKAIYPSSFARNDMTGMYVGTAGGFQLCMPFPHAKAYSMTINHNADDITMQINHASTDCEVSGKVSQRGKIANVDATFECTNGERGILVINQMEAGLYGLVGRAIIRGPTCSSIVEIAAASGG